MNFFKNRFSKLFLNGWHLALLALVGSLSMPPLVHGDLPVYYPQEEHLANYLSEMPWRYYKPYYVKGLAWFWIDEGKVDCVKDTVKAGKIWEPYIIAVLAKYIKPGDHVIDLGAHIGTITLAMSNLVGSTGMVHAFEGERQFFRELYFNIYSNQRSNIMPYLCWISDKEAVTEVTSYWHEGYSPVHQPIDGPWPLHTHQLDTFGFDNISVIKIDVESTEDEVLRGAQQTIAKSRPVIIIEIRGGLGHDNSPFVRNAIAHTISTLESMNYVLRPISIDDYLAVPKEKIK